MVEGSISLWTWLSAAGLLILTDLMFGAHFFLIWLGLCALIMAGLVYFIPELSWQMQFFYYFLLSALCLVFWRNYLKNNPITSDSPLLNSRTEQMVGNTYVLATDIKNGTGKIQVGDSQWIVKGPDASKGTSVKVVSADGMRLQVEVID
jgi:hypothetical protein